MEMRKGGLLIWLILVGLSSGNKIEGENEKLYGNRTSRSKKEKVNLIHVGVVVDEVSPSIGGAAQKCIKMGLLDFYALHPNYHNKLVVHIRDSQDVVAATSAVVDLVKNEKVHAIIGPESSGEATFMIKLGEKARVPIISFSATSLSISPSQSPFFVRTAQNDSSQVKAITAIVQGFGWHELVLIYEDTEYGRGLVPFLTDALQESNIRVPFKYAIPTSMDPYEISKHLHKMKNRQTRVFLVHVTSPFGSALFPLVDKAGMMSEGYAWLLTNALSSCLDAMDPLVIKSMEGVLGIRPHFPASEALENFKRRWKWSAPELNIYGLWAYDTIWALAMAAESIGEVRNLGFLKDRVSDVEGKTDIANLGVSEVGPMLLKEMLNIKFKGLSGDFHLVNGHLQPSAFEIFNVIGRAERLIGCWSPEEGICQKIADKKPNEKYSTSVSKLKKIIWPGDSITTPKGWAVPANGEKFRIGVPKKQGFNEFLDVTRNPRTGELNFTGFCIDVFRAVADALPFPLPYEFELFKDEAGDSSVIYDDLLHQLTESEKNKFDAVVGDITIVASRANHVDFSLPYTDSGVTMLVPIKHNMHRSMWVFLKPLSLDLWLTTIAASIATGIVLLILEHNGRRESLQPLDLLCLILWFPFSSLVLPERQIVTNSSSRFVLVVWLFLAFVLMQSYTASLSSILLSDQLQPKYFSVNELISKGYYVGYQEGSFTKSMLIEQLKFNESKLKSYANTEEYRKALSKGSQNGGVAAIFDEIPYLKIFLTKYGSDYVMAGPIYRTDGFGFAFPLNSRLVPYVSRAILNVTEGEKMVTIETKYFGAGNQNQDSSISSSDGPCLEVSSFGGLFIITGIALLLALIGSKTFIWQKPASVAKTYYRKYVSFQQHSHPDEKDKEMDDMSKSSEAVSADADHGSHDGGAAPAKQAVMTSFCNLLMNPSCVVGCSKNGFRKSILHDLHERQGQSPYYDKICRPATDLLPLLASGIKGVTSNPKIFERSILSSKAYDEQFRDLAKEGKDVESAYWELVTKDIRDTSAILEPIYRETAGLDGYVSVQVSPWLADNTEKTVEAAKWLHKKVGRPNVYIKIPATAESIPAIKQVISQGISVNTTLIFCISTYEMVIEAYLNGLECCGLSDLSAISGAAAFYISRVDAVVDAELEKIATHQALELRGKAARAQAAIAYKIFKEKFSGPRWEALAKRGAKKQRLMWASTNVKNQAYPDTSYIDLLIGPETISTIPEEALAAFMDHGIVSRTLDSNMEEAESVYKGIVKLGIDWKAIGSQLEDQVLDLFKKSYDTVLYSLQHNALIY